MSQTRDPNSTYCRRCGAELVWEHPKGSGHYQISSDYVGGDICPQLSGRAAVHAYRSCGSHG